MPYVQYVHVFNGRPNKVKMAEFMKYIIKANH